MPESNLKKEIKIPVENLVYRIFSDVFYRIAKTGVNRTVNELKKELKGKTIRSLQKKLETFSEKKLEKILDESTKQLTEKITQQGMEREDLIRQLEQGFRQSFKEKLTTLTKASILKIVVISICIIAVGAGVYAATADHPSRTPVAPTPRDTIAPVRYPDLIVTDFQVIDLLLGPLEENKEVVYAVHVTIRNQGTVEAGIFKVTVEGQKTGEPYYLHPFTVDGQGSSWYPYTSGPLPAGGEITFEGDVTIGPLAELGGVTVWLRATADSCLGDELQPGYCRVEESNENNNQYLKQVEIP